MNFFGKILLASNSPRRFQLLTDAGFEVEILNGKYVDETTINNIRPQDIPEQLALRKGTAYLNEAKHKGYPMVAADTIVIFNDVPIGKPVNRNDAFNCIKRLCGHTHEVITGVYLWVPDNNKETLFSVSTKVKFGNISDDMVCKYVENFSPLDKAGAYGIQEWIGLIGVEEIIGDYYNIMGFPVYTFVRKFMELSASQFPLKEI